MPYLLSILLNALRVWADLIITTLTHTCLVQSLSLCFPKRLDVFPSKHLSQNLNPGVLAPQPKQ